MMVSKNNKYQKELLTSQQVPHFGLRKLGIGVASVLLGTTFYFGGNTANVHADTTPAAANDNATKTTAANSAETGQTVTLKTASSTTLPTGALNAQQVAVNATNASSDSQAGVDIAIDHSALNNAVSGAQKAGLTVSEAPSKSNSTTFANVASAKNAIEQEEQSQATNIQNQTKAYQSNVAKLNSAAQDYSALDNAVSAANAQKIAGLTISQGSAQTITVDPTDNTAVTRAANGMANDYANQIGELRKAVATQEQYNQEYENTLKQYRNNLDQIPVIASNENGNIKLRGTFDEQKKNSINYFDKIIIDSSNLPKDTALITKIGWNINPQDPTRILGLPEKDNKIFKIPKTFEPESGTDYYDISDVIKNNGSITLTNFAQDSNKQNYDLKLTFANTYNGSNPNNAIQCVIMGKTKDGALDFVYYDGFNGINISNLQFIKHGSNKPTNILVGTLLSDLDFGQALETTMANQIAVTPSGSQVGIFYHGQSKTLMDVKGINANNFETSPRGTGVVVGLGSDFSLKFCTTDISDLPKNSGYLKNYHENPSSQGGTEVTLFGSDTTISNEPNQPTTTFTYHYNQVNPKQAKPITYHYNTLAAYNDQQTAQVIYRDKTENYRVLHEGPELTGYTGEKITDSTVNGEIKTLQDQGYVLSNNGFPDDAAFDDNTKSTQKFYIDFIHGTQPVNPHTPGTPGEPVNPNYPDGPKYPEGTDPKSLTKTITRTIHYVGAGEKTPVIDGYHVTNVDRDSQDKVNVDNATIHNTDADYTVTVTYAPNGKIIPVDPSHNPIPNVPTPQYPTDPTDPSKVTPDEPVPNVPGMTPETPTVTPKNPGKDTEVVYHEPTQDEGIVNVIVHDNTTGQNLPQYGWTSHIQKTGTKVDFDKPTTIKNLENAGYTVLNPDVTVPSEVAKGEVIVVINVEHGTVPVTPDTPGTPGQPVNPNNPDGPKYPEGTDQKSLTKTITRTIHYVGAGEKTPKDVQQPVTFTQSGVLDKVTGEWITPLAWKTTKQNIAGVKTPVIDGYHVVNVDRDSQDKVNVDGATIHNDDNNYTVTVTYAPNGKIVPVDPNGQPIPNVPTPQYPTNPTDPSKVTPDEPVPNVPGMTPETPTVTPTDPGKDTQVVYHVPTKDEGEVNVIVIDTTTGQDLTNYGWNSGTQKTGTKVDFDKPGTITKLENAGYKILNPDVTVPSEITKGTTNVVIRVAHGTTTVTPDKPGTPGQPVDPNNPNGPKYPTGTDLNSLKQTGTQTIHYVGAGAKTPADNKQSFDFTKTITFDNVTGKIISDSGWNVASHTFGEVTTPVVPGYHADKASAGKTTVTPTDLTKEVTVTYVPNGKIIPVDPNGQPIPNVPTPQYPTDPNDPTKVTPDEPVPTIPGQTPDQTTVTPQNPGQDTKVTYRVPSKNEGVVNVTVHDTTTGQNLTKYGWNSGTQKTGTKVNFDKSTTIKNLENAGYKVTNPDVTVPSEITKGTTNVVINVEHQIVPVTPDKPGNGLKNTDLTKTVTETVHYVGAGNQTPVDKTTQLHFTGAAYYDAVTKKWTDVNGNELKDQTKNITWTASDGNEFAAVATPAIKGYTASVQTGYDDGNGNVKAISGVDQDSADVNVTVTYRQAAQPTTPQSTEPATPQPTTPQPTEPATPQPTTPQPTTPQSTTAQPEAMQPTAFQPTVSQLTTSQPATSPLTMSQSGVQPMANAGAGYEASQSQGSSAQTSADLPQTGNTADVSAAALGLMGLAVATGLAAGATKKRHK